MCVCEGRGSFFKPKQDPRSVPASEERSLRSFKVFSFFTSLSKKLYGLELNRIKRNKSARIYQCKALNFATDL